MATMPNSVRDWGTENFAATLQGEMERFRRDVLPLAEVVGAGNTVYDDDLGVTLMEAAEEEGAITARVGVFFAEIVSCCSCGENPPIDEAYCEMRVRIDKESGEADFSVLPEYLR